jgi:hypothetical protein
VVVVVVMGRFLWWLTGWTVVRLGTCPRRRRTFELTNLGRLKEKLKVLLTTNNLEGARVF